jgi:hypothetical protein
VEHVRREVLGEDLKRRQHEPRGAIRVGAGTTAVHPGGRTTRDVQCLDAPGAVNDRGQGTSYRGQAELARPALAR